MDKRLVMSPVLTALLIPFLGTALGSAFVFFMKREMPPLLLIDYVTPHIHPVGGPEGPESRLSRTTKLALAVTIHNFPEGMAVGVAIAGALSGIVEPLGGALVLFLATSILGIMPYMLAFAAGAMLYVVVEELVPEYSQGEHSNIGTIGFALGFVLMMVLDVVLG